MSRVSALTLAALLVTAVAAPAQQLAIRWYGTQDGLASSNVTSIFQDSRGYVWVTTFDGVSRFDGAGFTTYRAPQSLPSQVSWVVTEDPHGRIWIGTQGRGVARLEDSGAPGVRAFRDFPAVDSTGASSVDAIAFDGRDGVWCITGTGLYRADVSREPPVFHKVYGAASADRNAALADGMGRVWFGLGHEVLEATGGRIIHHAVPKEYSDQSVSRLARRGDGTLLVALTHELLELKVSEDGDVWRSHRLDLGEDTISALTVTADGSVWIGTNRALIRDGTTGRQVFGPAAGITTVVTALHTDRNGRLWIGTIGGIGRLSMPAMTAFTAAQGLPAQIVLRVAEAGDGTLVASTWSGPALIRGDHVEQVHLPAGSPLKAIGRRMVADGFGRVWIGTRDGLFVIPDGRADLASAVRVGASNGLPPGPVTDGPGLRVDGGTMYVVMGFALYRGELRKDALPVFAKIADSTGDNFPLDVISDSSARIWIASFGGLFWLSPGGRPALPPQIDRMGARAFFRDAEGHLWIGTRSQGAAMTANPSASIPSFRTLTTAEGLSSDTAWSIAESGGRILFATGHGVDRLDRSTGAVDSLTDLAGWPDDEVYQVFVDRSDRLWAATARGLLRFNLPIELPALSPPPVYIAHLSLNGQALDVPSLGTARLSAPRMAASRSSLTIEYGSVDVDRPEPARYEHRLDGLDAQWSAPIADRAVSYPRLPPGRYTFEVRSVTRDGRGPIASVLLDVQPALWQRWWFIALSIAGLIGLALAIQRVRLGRVIALERVRRQIASDLHDDLGSGLAQIAVLAEVAQRGSGDSRAPVMADVADIARSLRSSVSEIVWAVDPRYDHVGDLVVHMREIAVGLLEPAGIALVMNAAADDSATLPPDRRRQVTLFFKEAMTNIARHAQATRVTVDVRTAGEALLVSIEDDGRGFEMASRRPGGRGVDNMYARAQAVGGRLDVDTVPGAGTRMTFACPLR